MKKKQQKQYAVKIAEAVGACLDRHNVTEAIDRFDVLENISFQLKQDAAKYFHQADKAKIGEAPVMATEAATA